MIKKYQMNLNTYIGFVTDQNDNLLGFSGMGVI
ncbi:hypothetical protein P344_07165 [Spiroplasma mirum ATCC 29335]|uniref:Uncharacterized protein n=1 Tax=Spiroplasma mirum ATCC 29335 TaxID=838561 RepID=W6AYB9_9MOLU|nr:hypothetical protein P344_07165 [Spiroplasma mirum ATCC 29335]AKM53605.1 hypothetical protein SATRI_v1c12730 [Spiroplasma atrichopogonis]